MRKKPIEKHSHAWRWRGAGKYLLLPLLLLACGQSTPQRRHADTPAGHSPPSAVTLTSDSLTPSIHVFVALCDNRYQGIVPVSAKVGNGQDPDNNLYWGWGYGVRTYFKKSAEWTFVRNLPARAPVLERILFRHRSGHTYLVADAYDGRNMKECITDFLQGLSGQKKALVADDTAQVGLYGHARLLAFVGHDGLMDFRLPDTFQNADGRKRDCIILACYSRNYFAPFVKSAGANPLLWTTGLMGPEAYTLHDAFTGYVRNESPAAIQSRAARAYAKYTKCTEKAAKRLIVTGE